MVTFRRILLVDHGSRLAAANATVERLAAALARATGSEVVAAHMELAPPLLVDELERAARDGVGELWVVPLFVVPGKHFAEDVRAPVEALRRRGVRVELLPPLAEQEAFVGFLATALEEAGFRA